MKAIDKNITKLIILTYFGPWYANTSACVGRLHVLKNDIGSVGHDGGSARARIDESHVNERHVHWHSV